MTLFLCILVGIAVSMAIHNYFHKLEIKKINREYDQRCVAT